MNINKYIELLRFYLTEKIDETQQSFQKTIVDEIDDVICTILSSVFALFISTECIEADGVLGVIFKITTIILVYFGTRLLFKKILRILKTKRELSNSNRLKLTSEEAKNLIEKFDHIACDSILLAWDFIDKKQSISHRDQKNFCIIEAFYYYKKAVEITCLIINNPNTCINNLENSNGISRYRLNNVYDSLKDINDQIDTELTNVQGIAHINEFKHEFEQSKISLGHIKKFIDEIYVE